MPVPFALASPDHDPFEFCIQQRLRRPFFCMAPNEVAAFRPLLFAQIFQQFVSVRVARVLAFAGSERLGRCIVVLLLVLPQELALFFVALALEEMGGRLMVCIPHCICRTDCKIRAANRLP